MPEVLCLSLEVFLLVSKSLKGILVLKGKNLNTFQRYTLENIMIIPVRHHLT